MLLLRDGQAQAPAIHRADYQAPAWWIDTVDLTFDLDPAKTRVLNKMRLRRNPDVAAQPLRLDGEELNLARVLVNGGGTSFKMDGNQLVLENLPEGTESFDLEIFTTCAPAKNTQLMGLYVSQGTFFTQCEAEGFRRITYFLDRPDVMASYTVTLRADKALYPVLLSPTATWWTAVTLDDGRHFAKWVDPHKKPCYLFALVAGKLVAREQLIKSRSGKPPAAGVRAPRRPGQDRARHELADGQRGLGRGALWPAARPGALHDRRHQRLQHGRHGEQGPEHLQHQVCSGQRSHRHRHRLRQHRKRGRPRVFPQLDGQPRHLPRLVPAQPERRPHGLPRPGIQPGPGRQPIGPRRQAHRRRARAAHRPVPRRRRPHGPPGAARQLHRDQQLLHRHHLRKRCRGGAHDAHLVGREGFAQGHEAVLRAPRRPGRDL
jgi:hypothetical protein